jgi:2-polyprenyl-6-methoxyphenol hydroxylase-like FAD-dependent oxidoreductase
MGGLATAQTLSNHFDRVTIVERDGLPDGPENRPGVPQGHHLHVLLAGGTNALETLLPGFSDGLMGAGAIQLAFPTEMLWLNPMGWVRHFEPRHRMLSASRALMEWHTRRMVGRNPRIGIIDRHNAVDLQLSEDRRRVTGVCVASTSSDPSERITVEPLHADLVVDATGRRSRAVDWLERLGYERPSETRIDAHLSYATRIYRRPFAHTKWKAIFLQAQPRESSRMGVLFAIEEDRWIVTLQGAGGDRPPTSDDGFDAFAGTLRSAAIRDAIRTAEPLTEPVGWANTANVRRHFDRARLPDRFLAVADSACAFNPVYGQGISVAAQTAVVLDHELTEHRRKGRSLDGFTKRMQKRVAKCADGAWMIATGDDLRFPGTTGATPSRLMRMQHRYLDRVLAAATVDEHVMEGLLQAFLLLAPPTVLFRPGIVARAWRRGGAPNHEPPMDSIMSTSERAAVA